MILFSYCLVFFHCAVSQAAQDSIGLHSIPVKVEKFSQKRKGAIIQVRTTILFGPGHVDVRRIEPSSLRLHLYDKNGETLTRKGLFLESVWRERRRLFEANAILPAMAATPIPCRTAFPNQLKKSATPTPLPFELLESKMSVATNYEMDLPRKTIGKIKLRDGGLVLSFRGSYIKRKKTRRPDSLSIGGVSFKDGSPGIDFRVTGQGYLLPSKPRNQESSDEGSLPVYSSAANAGQSNVWCYYSISTRQEWDPEQGDGTSLSERCGFLYAVRTRGVESLVVGDDKANGDGFAFSMCPFASASSSNAATGFWKIQFDLNGSNCGSELYDWTRESKGELFVQAGFNAKSTIAFASRTTDSEEGSDSTPISAAITADRLVSCTRSIQVGVSASADSDDTASLGANIGIGVTCSENNDQPHKERYNGGGEISHSPRYSRHFSVAIRSGIKGELFAGGVGMNGIPPETTAMFSASGSTEFLASADCCHCYYPATYKR